MSNLYPPEGRLLHTLQNRANVETLSRLRQAMARETVVEGRVTLCTPAHDLVVQLGPFTGTIPREEAALGIREGTARAPRAAAMIVNGGVAAAMNQFNGKQKSDAPQ